MGALVLLKGGLKLFEAHFVVLFLRSMNREWKIWESRNLLLSICILSDHIVQNIYSLFVGFLFWWSVSFGKCKPIIDWK